ncbi:hypothetical protein BHE74_00034162 [Ensete ventricosum]|nr:hypothetical protein BHE74_00034162 [Ensete ventricosum]
MQMGDYGIASLGSTPVLPKQIQNVDEKQLPQTRTLLGTGGDFLFQLGVATSMKWILIAVSKTALTSPGRGSRVSCSSSGSGGYHTRLKKGTQQGMLQFAGLWRLPHTAEEGEAVGQAAVRQALEAATHSRTQREEAGEATLAKGAHKFFGLFQSKAEEGRRRKWHRQRERKAEREKGAAECQARQKTTPWSAAPESISVAVEDSTVASNRRQHCGRQQRRKQEIDRRSMRNLRLRR